jgi:hypothetical protein
MSQMKRLIDDVVEMYSEGMTLYEISVMKQIPLSTVEEILLVYTTYE